MTHEVASEFLGAYALDAVDGEELHELEAHVDTCPRCRAELDTLREVAGAIGQSVEPLPEGLWSNIVSQLPAGFTCRKTIPVVMQHGVVCALNVKSRPPASTAQNPAQPENPPAHFSNSPAPAIKSVS